MTRLVVRTIWVHLTIPKQLRIISRAAEGVERGRSLYAKSCYVVGFMAWSEKRGTETFLRLLLWPTATFACHSSPPPPPALLGGQQ